MRAFVSSTSLTRLAETVTRGSMTKIITSIRNAMMTCIAYCIKTTMSENSPMRSIIAAGDVTAIALMSAAPIQ